jgi:uncharacterized membrane protein YkoI
VTRKARGMLGAAAAIVSLALGGAGAAGALGGGEDDERGEQADGRRLTGATAERARRAALAAADGGRVLEAEGDDDSDAAYEVAVERPDGTVVEVQLNQGFGVCRLGQDD